MMRVLFWNIMAGGGKRADAIVAQIIRWQPDIISLAESECIHVGCSWVHANILNGLP